MNERDAIRALAALAHPARLRTVRLLLAVGEGGLPAGEIAGILGVPRSTLSAHLHQLEETRLLCAHRRGARIVYALDPAGGAEVARELLRVCGQEPRALYALTPGTPRPTGRRAATVSPLLPRRRRLTTEDDDMPDTPLNVLFLCSANSARSLFAESLLNRLGAGRFRAYSAGSVPAGAPNPLALEVLERNNMVIEDLRSKSWDEFTGEDAPVMDFVFTVCDTVSGEACPTWRGQPVVAHWGTMDPVAVTGEDWERRAAFTMAFVELRNRIDIFVNLPLDDLDRVRLAEQLAGIGRRSTGERPTPAVAG